ncbi:MAG: hypothetical protein GQ528_01695, partial [Woeseiaceae bacterium]|nr:hypothetical protein [Woeseiaceae bacterium]
MPNILMLHRAAARCEPPTLSTYVRNRESADSDCATLASKLLYGARKRHAGKGLVKFLQSFKPVIKYCQRGKGLFVHPPLSGETFSYNPTMVRIRSNHFVLSPKGEAVSENSVVGPRASVFSPGKDGEAGDIGFIVDAAGCSQAENKPLEARSSFQTEPIV